jgi:rsbT co-antagonist protein RsbR
LSSILSSLIERYDSDLLGDWLRLQVQSTASQRIRLSDSQLRASSQEFLREVRSALASSTGESIQSTGWTGVRELLGDLSRQRASQGFTPKDTAVFVFSFKQALFNRMRQEFADDAATLVKGVLEATELFDQLGLYTTEVAQKSREDVIARQQQEMLELSTPVIELWKGILALPLIGTLDSQRTQIVMQNLLEALVARNSDLAIIDITGVPTVDTLVAQHLLKTVAAARLMGAECIISGIRPQIAQTIIHLGVDLGDVQTKATLASAFQFALNKKNLKITKTA